jgi:hypothetical protein
MNGVMGGSVEGIEGATGVNGVDGAEGIEDVTVVDGTEGIDLYLLAGVKTWPSYFLEPARRLRQMSLEAGYAVAEVQVLYPYGDHTFPMLRQVRQVARDVARRLALGADRLPLTDIGGFGADEESGGAFIADRPADGSGLNIDAIESRSADRSGANGAAVESRPAYGSHQTTERETGVLRAPEPQPERAHAAPAPPQPSRMRGAAAAAPADKIAEVIRARSAGRAVVLIGHSGGGVAAYHAGRRLLAEGAVRDLRIVQIGSPKVRIHPALRHRTAYFYAADERGRIRDPITRLGTWGGIRRAAAGIPVWDSRRWAPGHIAPIAIDGGHKDYFVHGPSAAPERPTNMERTAAAVMDWLVRSLRPANLRAHPAVPPAEQADPQPRPAPAQYPLS